MLRLGELGWGGRVTGPEQLAAWPSEFLSLSLSLSLSLFLSFPPSLREFL